MPHDCEIEFAATGVADLACLDRAETGRTQEALDRLRRRTDPGGAAQRRARNPRTPVSGIWVPGSRLRRAPERPAGVVIGSTPPARLRSRRGRGRAPGRYRRRAR